MADYAARRIKTMPAKDPSTYSALTYAWVCGLASWGGLVNWFRKRREGAARPFNFAELVGELATSALAGVITFWLCESAAMSGLLSAVLISISGHMGSRLLFALERVVEARINKITDHAQGE